MRQLITTFAILLLTQALYAQDNIVSDTDDSTNSEVERGLARLKSNAENSRFNLSQHQNNLKISTDNINDLSRAITDLEMQRVALDKKLLEANQSSTQTNKDRENIERLMSEEKKLGREETRKLAELQKIEQQLRANINKRQENVIAYEEQRAQFSQQADFWKQRQNLLNQSLQDVDKQKSQLSQDKNTWVKKQKIYSDNVKKWETQSEKFERKYKTYSQLASR